MMSDRIEGAALVGWGVFGEYIDCCTKYVRICNAGGEIAQRVSILASNHAMGGMACSIWRERGLVAHTGPAEVPRI